MSKLVDETDEYIELTAWVHGLNDSYSDWELNPDGSEKYGIDVHEAEHYALEEFQIRYRIDKLTGEVTYLAFL